MGALPPEMLQQILIRLEVRDLTRFKSVSKSWLSLISDPKFIKAHLDHGYLRDREDAEFGDRRFALCRSLCCFTHFSNEFKNDIFVANQLYLLGSSDGLVCTAPSFGNILIVNPSTREVKKLRYPESQVFVRYLWGFGYDSAIDDYKVVSGFEKGDFTEFQVLTLKSGKWEYAGVVPYTFTTRTGVFCNGALHWLGYNHSPQQTRPKQKVILSFDLSQQLFKEVPTPDDGRYGSAAGRYPFLCLGTVEGCLCVFVPKLVPHNIWVMKDYNVKESWRVLDPERELKFEAVHCLKRLSKYPKNNRSLRGAMWLCQSLEFVGFPTYIPSLVSPHGSRESKRKRRAKRQRTEG